MRRNFPRERKISELEEKEYVAIIGTVVGRDEKDYSLIVDDGSGSVKVLADRIFEVGEIVCAMGRVEKAGVLLLSDALVVGLDDFDRSLYARVRDMEGVR